MFKQYKVPFTYREKCCFAEHSRHKLKLSYTEPSPQKLIHFFDSKKCVILYFSLCRSFKTCTCSIISSTLPAFTASGLMIINVTSFLVGTGGVYGASKYLKRSAAICIYQSLVQAQVLGERPLREQAPRHSNLHLQTITYTHFLNDLK